MFSTDLPNFLMHLFPIDTLVDYCIEVIKTESKISSFFLDSDDKRCQFPLSDHEGRTQASRRKSDATSTLLLPAPNICLLEFFHTCNLK